MQTSKHNPSHEAVKAETLPVKKLPNLKLYISQSNHAASGVVGKTNQDEILQLCTKLVTNDVYSGWISFYPTRQNKIAS